MTKRKNRDMRAAARSLASGSDSSIADRLSPRTLQLAALWEESRLIEDAKRRQTAAVHGALQIGCTWAQIGEAAGVSADTARKRWGVPKS